MKTSDFKKIIKDSVREAIKEELKDILLEALKSPKTIVKENIQSPLPSSSPTDYLNQRKAYTDILNSMSPNINGDIFNFNTNSMPFQPTPVNTSAEGSSLPSGEISLDQIMKLTNGV
jgi:hypothetical protein